MSTATSYIEPSTFNRRISVKRAATIMDNGAGTGNDGFATRFTTWASVIEMSTSRKAYYGLDLFTNYWEVILRYDAGRTFNTSDLIDYEDVTLQVQSIQIVSQNYKKFTQLVCVDSGLS